MTIHPIPARKRISDFLIAKTDIKKKLIIELAVKQLSQIKDCSNEDKAISDDELKNYIRNNYVYLEGEAKNSIDAISKFILPTSPFSYCLTYLLP